MKVFIKGHNFEYEIINVIRLFFQDAAVFELNEKKKIKNQDYVYTLVIQKAKKDFLFCEVCYKGIKVIGSRQLDKLDEKLNVSAKSNEKELAKLVFSMLCNISDKRPPYGILTGIRPAKLAIALLENGATISGAEKRLMYDYFVTAKKAKLIVSVAKFSEKLRKQDMPSDYSLYVSIPFCKTRCSFCSFVSKTIASEQKLIDPYLESLIQELELTRQIAAKKNLNLKTVYVGGGTPSVLNEQQLEKLCEAIERLFNPKKCLEYTFEAGRADTITKQKLAILKRFGVTRLSINPQTKNDEVLKKVGRTHSYKDVERCFSLAREIGFDNINADLIAGLPFDTEQSFKESVDWLSNIGADNITVHTLTVKRGSDFKDSFVLGEQSVSEMTEYAIEKLVKSGYLAYYMYRQKSTLQNLENIGYCKPDKEGLYNIFIMDEMHSIFSCGAGGVTKFKQPLGTRIERVFNYKYPKEYIEGLDEILRRKRKVLDFYDNKF